jgi:hypothetical protein
MMAIAYLLARACPLGARPVCAASARCCSLRHDIVERALRRLAGSPFIAGSRASSVLAAARHCSSVLVARARI